MTLPPAVLLDPAAMFGAAILTKATLALLMTLGVVRLARRSRAAVRHLLLVAGFATVLVLPIAAVLAPPVRVEVAPVPFMFEGYLGEAAVSLDDLDPTPAVPLQGSTATPAPWENIAIPKLAAAIWMGGSLLFGMPVLIGMLHVIRLRRTGMPWRAGQRLADALAREAGLHRPIDVVLHESVAAPATCGIGRHAVLFPLDADTWTDEDVLRAVVHEVEHVRRADCLVNAVARLICAAYWFHPLVWVAWRRLGLEAERACDDAVLRRADPEAYADQLVTLAERLSSSARHPLLAMANRSDLVERVKAVLDQRQARGHAGVAAVVAIAITATILIATLSPLQAVGAPPGPALGGQQRAAAGAADRFDVATIRINRSGDTPGLSPGASRPAAPQGFAVASVRRNTAGGVPRMRVEGGRFVAANTSLLELIRDAYRMQSFQVVGGPEWVRAAGGRTRAAPASQRTGEVTFDIIATIPENTPPAQVPLLLRTMLADRFALVVHTEMRDSPVYVLTYARDDKRLGPQLTRSAQQCRTQIDGGPLRAPVTGVTGDGTPMCGMMMSPAAIRGGGLTLPFLANALAGYTGRMVVDRTSLEGPFDFHLTYAAAAARGGGPALPEDRPSIFTAVQEQLGLKLEPATAPVEVLVIDGVSLPSEN